MRLFSIQPAVYDNTPFSQPVQPVVPSRSHKSPAAHQPSAAHQPAVSSDPAVANLIDFDDGSPGPRVGGQPPYPTSDLGANFNNLSKHPSSLLYRVT